MVDDFFFSKNDEKKADKKQKKCNTLSSQNRTSSLSLIASTNDSRVRTRAHKNGHARTHARKRERDLENSLRKCGRVLLLLSMMKPRRF